MPKGYRYVGTHPDNLESGRPLAPGDRIATRDVDPGSPNDGRLLEEGLLIGIDVDPDELSGDDLEARARDLNIEGRSKMSADALREAVAKAEKGN